MKAESAKQFIEKTRSGYNAIAESFSRTRATLWPALYLFKDYIKEANKVLDIGCGNGRLINLFNDKEIDYLGIDYSEPLVEIAKENFPDRRFEVGDLLNLKQSSDEFDVVLLIAVLHHIPSDKLRRKALKQIYRVLRPGGYLLMTNWNLWQMRFWRYHLKFYQERKKGSIDLDPGDIIREWGGTGNFRYVHAFTLNELNELAQPIGFKVVENKYVKYSGKKGNFLHSQNILTILKK